MALTSTICNGTAPQQRLTGQRGLSLVELMIGMAVGLLILSGALTVYIGSVRTSSETLHAAALNQQLRAAMALMSSDLRRAGYWGKAKPGVSNPFTAITTDLHIVSNGSCILYTYDRDEDGTVDEDEYLGFRKNGNKIQMRRSGTTTNDGGCAEGSWQTLIDDNVVNVDTLKFTTAIGKCRNISTDANWTVMNEYETANPCADTTALGYVTPAHGDKLVETRQINIRVAGHVKNDSTTTKVLKGSVRVRNDRMLQAP